MLTLDDYYSAEMKFFVDSLNMQRKFVLIILVRVASSYQLGNDIKYFSLDILQIYFEYVGFRQV